MKKFFIVLTLLLVIALSFSFSILRLMSRGSEDNFFNKNYRLKFDRSLFLRQIFGLHYDGDARWDYLNKDSSKISIEIDQMAGLEIPQSALDLLTQKMKQITGKDVEYFYSDENIPFQETVDQQNIREIAARYKSLKVSGPYIYLLYLSQAADSDSMIGSTFEENGILLFARTIEDFTQTNPGVFSRYVESTALHEFGHQIGLDHNTLPDCLMNESADEYLISRELPNEVITDFCGYEKILIKQQQT